MSHHPPRKRLRRLLILSTGVAAVAALSLGGATAAGAATTKAFPGAKPSWAKASADAGDAPADTTVEGEIFLDLRDPAGAERLAKAVSTPGNRSYHKYVSPKSWIDRFSPKASDYRETVGALKAAGFTVVGQPKSRLFVVFRGEASAVDAAFQASLRRYHYRGHTLVAPSRTPNVPARFGSRVSGIVLDQARTLTRPQLASTATPSAADRTAATPKAVEQTGIPAPCSDYYGENTAEFPEAYGTTTFPTNICGYNGEQLREATGVPQNASGAGQTVAIIDAYASPTIVSDVNRLSISRGQRPLTTYSQKVPAKFYDQALCQQPSGWQGEQTLDVQAVHNIAPKAKIFYEGGFNCGGGLDVALSDILDNNRASIVTNSYGNAGEPPLYLLKAEENQHLQAAAEGIGLYYSSGDSGDESIDENGNPTLPRQPDYFATSPWVTGVGGTSLGIAKDGSVALQTGWGSAVDPVVKDTATGALGYGEPLPGEFSGGAGGGASGLFAQPFYQKGVVPAGLAGGRRTSPDVSADADPYTGEVIGISPIVDETTLATGDYEEQTYGGTSLASPLFAATVALAQQASHRRVGFLNPVLYAAYKAKPSSVRDVLPATAALAYTSVNSGNSYLVTLDRDTSLTTRKGYDTDTGLGSPTLSQLSRIVKR